MLRKIAKLILVLNVVAWLVALLGGIGFIMLKLLMVTPIEMIIVTGLFITFGIALLTIICISEQGQSLMSWIRGERYYHDNY